MLAAEERYAGYITANSLTDIYYIASKHLPAEAVREALRNLMQRFQLWMYFALIVKPPLVRLCFIHSNAPVMFCKQFSNRRTLIALGIISLCGFLCSLSDFTSVP